MNRWHLLGVALGLGLGAAVDAAADCAYFYQYEWAELELLTVEIDGVPVDDLSAYDGYRVELEATPSGLMLTATGVDGYFEEVWQ
jgi:hypothetical protein